MVAFNNLPEELQAIGICESRLIENAKNPKSSASGIFQFIDGTAEWVGGILYGDKWDMKYKNNPYVQIHMAKWLYDNSGPSHWECYTLKMI